MALNSDVSMDSALSTDVSGTLIDVNDAADTSIVDTSRDIDCTSLETRNMQEPKVECKIEFVDCGEGVNAEFTEYTEIETMAEVEFGSCQFDFKSEENYDDSEVRCETQEWDKDSAEIKQEPFNDLEFDITDFQHWFVEDAIQDVQNENPEIDGRYLIQQDAIIPVKKTPTTSAERMRAYRERKQQLLQNINIYTQPNREYHARIRATRSPKKPPKSSAERVRAYRERMKLKQLQQLEWTDETLFGAEIVQRDEMKAIEPGDITSVTFVDCTRAYQGCVKREQSEQSELPDFNFTCYAESVQEYQFKLLKSAKKRPMTSAERTKAYRERRKLKLQIENGMIPKRLPMSAAERSRAYRERKKRKLKIEGDRLAKRLPMSSAERSRAYRKRKELEKILQSQHTPLL